MSDAEQIFVADKEGVEQKGKKATTKIEQTVDFLDETQRRAAAAYTAYIEAQRQLEEAYKGQEGQADKTYNEAVEQSRKSCEESMTRARKAYEESIARALRTRDEAELKAQEARNEAMERTWAVFIKARK